MFNSCCNPTERSSHTYVRFQQSSSSSREVYPILIVPLALTSKSTELYHRDTVSPGRNTPSLLSSTTVTQFHRVATSLTYAKLVQFCVGLFAKLRSFRGGLDPTAGFFRGGLGLGVGGSGSSSFSGFSSWRFRSGSVSWH